MNTAQLAQIAELLATSTGADHEAIRRQACRTVLTQRLGRAVPVTEAMIDAMITELDAA
jgi:hypothetical protein